MTKQRHSSANTSPEKSRSFEAIIVGRSILLREGLAGILRATNFRVVASVSSAKEFLTGKMRPVQPLFLIVHTGDDFDAILEQIMLLRGRSPSGRIAIVADHYRSDELISAFRAGANGYFAGETCDVFVISLELVMMGKALFPSALLPFLLERHRSEMAHSRSDCGQVICSETEDKHQRSLSPRERMVLRCLVAGDSNKRIARKIEIAEATVKVHIKAILRKINVRNRTQAAIWGMNNGWLDRTEETAATSLTSAMDDLKTIHEPDRTKASISPDDENDVEPLLGDVARSGTGRFRR